MTDRAPCRRVVECMGTVFSFDVRGPGVTAVALERAVAWLHWVDETFSTYKQGSQISRLGRGETTVAECAPEVREVLDECDRLERETGGYFSARPSGDLDPSGLVKGWAIERASDLLVADGSTSHCVNGGGDVQCVGEAAPGKPWRVGITDPHDPTRLIATVVGTGLAVATSGTAERGAHVLDPNTARPPEGLASVTVCGPHLALADAYATAAFAMGSARARDWLAGLVDYRALVVDVDGGTWSSPGFGAAA